MPSLREKLTQEAVFIHKPGAKFSYSNTGYHLLELLIEEVSKQSFSKYIHSEIFLPLGMETATFDLNDDMTPYPPTGYNLKKEPVPVYMYPEKSSGGLFATANDIARFLSAGMKENPVLKDESIQLMYLPQCSKIGIYTMVFDAYGLGHYIETQTDGLVFISHGGQGNGVMTHFHAVPESGDAIVILTNSQRSWPFISYLLRDWTHWLGFKPLGMERILWGHYALCAVIGILITTSLIMVIKISLGSYQQNQKGSEFFSLGICLILLGALTWCACQKYLFLSSVFPILSPWLGLTALVLSVTLLVRACLSLYNRYKNVV